MRVALIIVTYNGSSYIDELFESLITDTYPKEKLGIFVIDNSSMDDTILKIRGKESRLRRGDGVQSGVRDVVVIQNSDNRFFAVAVNQGASAAILRGYEMLIILNQDTRIVPGWITEMLWVANQNSEIAVVQPRLMLFPFGSGVVNSIGNEVFYLGHGFCGGYLRQWEGMSQQQLRYWDIVSPSGAAMMLSAKIWCEIGGFDESLQMYYEDQDLGWKLRLMGKRMVCARDAVVYHRQQSQPSGLAYYFLQRNRLLVVLSYYQIKTIILLLPLLILAELGALIGAFQKRRFHEKLRAFKDMILLLPVIYHKRRYVSTKRKVSDRVILEGMLQEIHNVSLKDSFLLRYIANPLFGLYYRLLLWIIWW